MAFGAAICREDDLYTQRRDKREDNVKKRLYLKDRMNEKYHGKKKECALLAGLVRTGIRRGRGPCMAGRDYLYSVAGRRSVYAPCGSNYSVVVALG